MLALVVAEVGQAFWLVTKMKDKQTNTLRIILISATFPFRASLPQPNAPGDCGGNGARKRKKMTLTHVKFSVTKVFEVFQSHCNKNFVQIYVFVFRLGSGQGGQHPFDPYGRIQCFC